MSVRLRASGVDMTRALQLISAAIFLTLVILSCATDAGMCVYFKLEFAIFILLLMNKLMCRCEDEMYPRISTL